MRQERQQLLRGGGGGPPPATRHGGRGETVLLLSWVKRIKRKTNKEKKKEFNLFKSQELILNAFLYLKLYILINFTNSS